MEERSTASSTASTSGACSPTTSSSVAPTSSSPCTSLRLSRTGSGSRCAPSWRPSSGQDRQAIAPGSESHKSKKIDYLAVTAAGEVPGRVRRAEDRCGVQERAAGRVPSRGAGRRSGWAARGAAGHPLQERCHAEVLSAAVHTRAHGPARAARTVSRHHEAPAAEQQYVAACDSIVITAPSAPPRIVYVQPTGDGPYTIGFGELAGLVERHADPVSQRFAASLRAWASSPASVARAVDPEVEP